MAGDVGIGFVDILPRSDTFVKALTGQMQGAFKNVQGTMTNVAKSFTGVQVAAVGAGLLAAGAIAKGISATQEWASEVRSLQRVTGLAAEDASKLAAAGTALGIPISKLNVAFGLLAKNVVNGSTNFDKYGIATKNAAGGTLPFLDILGNITDKFATLKPGADQAAFAMNVFGRSGKDLIPVLQRGSAGLQELYDQAQAAGLVMGQDTLDAAKNLTVAQNELGEAAKGASIKIGEGFLPVMTEVTQILTTVVDLVQLIPTPVIAVGAAFITLSAGVIVAQKAFIALKGVTAGSLETLTGVVPLVAAIGFAFTVVAGQIADANINFDALAEKSKITADVLQFLADKMNLSGSAFEGHSFQGFIASLDGVGDNLDSLTTGLQPAIDQMGKLGFSTDATSQIIADMSTHLDGSAGSIDNTITAVEATIKVIDDIGKHFAQGKISLSELITDLGQFGISAPDAVKIANAALDSFGKHLDDSGKKVLNFAGLTSKALKSWSTDLTSSLTDTFGSLGTTIKNTFTETPKELQKAFSQMLAATVRYRRDQDALLKMKPGTFGLNQEDMGKFQKYMLDQGPAFVDAFVRSTTAQQQTIVTKWAANVGQLNKLTAGIKPGRLDVDTSHATAQVQQWITATEAQRLTITENVRFQAQNPPTQHPWTGGLITPHGLRRFATGGPAGDTIPALLTPGEFVLRRSAVERIGLDALRQMNAGGTVPDVPTRGLGVGKQKMDGALRIYDWRNGLATLDGEMAWEDTVRTR